MLIFIIWVCCLILFTSIYKYLDKQVPLDVFAEEQLEETKKAVVMLIVFIIILGIALLKQS